MMPRALITGITGMVGSHLVDYLLEKTDWHIFGMVRWRSSLENLSQHTSKINTGERLHLLYGDLTDTVSLHNIIEKTVPDYVFHLAAQSFPRTSFDAPINTIDVNTQGTTRLMEAIRRFAPDALVHVCSSSEVYGRVPRDKLPINEECQFHPASPYAISKVGTDLIARFYAEAYGLKVLTTRMFTHTGPRRGDVFAESTFAKQIALAEKNLIEPVIRVGNLDSLRTIADVRDAVRAYHLLLTEDPIPGRVYNIGGLAQFKVGEILEYLINLSNISSKLEVEVDPARLRPIDADLQVPDMTAFVSHTGWTPEIPFEKTMVDLLEFWRERVSKNGDAYLSR